MRTSWLGAGGPAVITILIVTALSISAFGSHDWFEFFRAHASEGFSANRIYLDPARSYLDAPNYSLIHVIYFTLTSFGLKIEPSLISVIYRISLGMAGFIYFIIFRRELTIQYNILLLFHVILIFFLPSF